MWAGQNWNTTPDIMCLAKGIAGGIPMACSCQAGDNGCNEGRGAFFYIWWKPIACCSGTATMEALIDDKLVDNAAQMGLQFKEGLNRLKEKHRIIREVRGIGMMLGVELRFDVKDILFDGIRRGLLVLYSGRNILRLLPPLVMDEMTVSRVIDILDVILADEEKRRNVS